MLVALAATGGMPAKTSAGKVRKVPPPAMVLRMPAPKAAAQEERQVGPCGARQASVTRASAVAKLMLDRVAEGRRAHGDGVEGVEGDALAVEGGADADDGAEEAHVLDLAAEGGVVAGQRAEGERLGAEREGDLGAGGGGERAAEGHGLAVDRDGAGGGVGDAGLERVQGADEGGDEARSPGGCRSSKGSPTCSATPAFITTMRSDIDSASSWSWVT